ncbi:MAG TPA: hypothetical protein VF407_14020, partial [Polyangiaceae bacterium]
SVLGSVESAVAVGAAGGAIATTACAAKVVTLPAALVIGVATFVAGAAVGWAVHPNGVVPAPPAPTASASPIAPPSASAEPAPVLPPVTPVLSTSAAPSANPHAPSFEDGDLVREREMLDVARAALAHGHPADAVVEAQRHERRFPRGYLAEEREVVWIQALVAEGHLTDADARAAKFHERFPQSALAGAVDAAVGTKSNDASTDPGAP